MDETICPKCNCSRGLGDFNFRNKTKGIRQHWCKFCLRAYAARHYREYPKPYKERARRHTATTRIDSKRRLLEYLSSHPCVDCGESDPVVLEFDHVNGEKNREVTAMANGSYCWKTIEAEIRKCEVVCANCHRRRTCQRIGSWRLMNRN
jgi:hypothetical protein